MTHTNGNQYVLFFLVTIVSMGSSYAKSGSLFDGVWTKTVRQHTDCSYSATANITFTTDSSGVTRGAVDAFGSPLTGKAVGRTYTFSYGIVNGKPTGRGSFTVSTDGKGFSGTFADNTGHKGTWTGKRSTGQGGNNPPIQTGKQFDGLWPKTVRKHTDCSYSATANITFTTDTLGVTRGAVESFGTPLTGKIVGRSYTFEYGIVNGKPTGRGSFTISADGKSFTGTFSDNAGHRGTWSGSR